mmetsp:Transcript_138048/g.344669  ORF Transcript_138048/g.344669 Transcript_138048/m.344669 type:complete len:801 (-) Transcript_138048:84-2486(-)
MAKFIMAAAALATGSLADSSSVAMSASVSASATARQQALEAVWGAELDGEEPEPVAAPSTRVKKYVSPVKRVVNLLMKMKAELDAEANKEAEMYDKMVCWCETSQKEKTQAVAEAESKDTQLSSEVEERSARFGELSTGIVQLKDDIAANTEALKKAQAIREAEAAAFREQEKDMTEAITNLRNAIAVLSKHQGGSMLQLDRSVLSGMRVLLRDVALKYEVLQAGREEHRQAGATKPAAFISLQAAGAVAASEGADTASLLSALDAHGAHVSDALPLKFAARVVAQEAGSAATDSRTFLQMRGKQPIFESRSSARSSQIYGILQQMQEEFEAELAQAQQTELKAQADYTALSGAKAAEIDTGKAKLDEMEVEGAANQKALSDAKEDLSITREQRSEDVEFLRNLKLTCNDLDDQWQKRSKTRAAESKAVAEAIAILTEDDNRETLARSVSFVQEHAVVASNLAARRSSAVAALHRAAESPDFEADDLLAAWQTREGTTAPSLGAAAGPRAQLATLAVTAQIDSFEKVKELMDKMIADLKEQQEKEVKFKDYCQEEQSENERTIYQKGELKKDLEDRISHLETVIARMKDEIAEAKSQISATQVEIKKAGQQREAENAQFQEVVADQRATQTILNKALVKLKDFYEKGIGKAVLLEAGRKGFQTPPEQFNDYKASAGSNSVIGLIEQIIEDSKGLEGESIAGETKAQTEYETFVQDSNGLINSLQEAVVSKTGAIASSKSEAAEAAEDLESTESALESLEAYKADLQSQCSFTLKNFDIRQKARLQEIESVQQAKSILSGA